MKNNSDDYNTRDDDNVARNQDSGKAVALQASSASEYDLALNMQHSDDSTNYPTKTINFISQYPPSYSTPAETGKSLFTNSQWQEFESQKTFFKHIMASITPLPVPPQSNRSGSWSGTGLRFSVGSDPEPWRCRRTDGKKWRCSRDVIPEQRYCERHAHKTRTRPRSRKLVETQTHQPHKTTNENYHPTLVPTSSCQQSRFIKTSGIIPLSTSSNQKIHDSVGFGSSKRDHFPQQLLEGTHHQDLLGVWSTDDCSLSLSNTCKDDQDFFQSEIDTSTNEDRGINVQVSNHPWVNSWLGGPLGEALCPSIISTSNEPPNIATSSGSSLNDSGRGLH